MKREEYKRHSKRKILISHLHFRILEREPKRVESNLAKTDFLAKSLKGSTSRTFGCSKSLHLELGTVHFRGDLEFFGGLTIRVSFLHQILMFLHILSR